MRGRYTAEQAARKALEDSGLQLSRTGNGTLTVRRAKRRGPPRPPSPRLRRCRGHHLRQGAGGHHGGHRRLRDQFIQQLHADQPIAAGDAPVAHGRVTRQRLDDQRSAHLSDVPEGVSGIFVTRDGLGAESDGFWSRGFEIQNYEVDGVPTSSLLNHYSENMAMYDRVENRHDSVYTYLNGMLQRDGSGTSLLPTRFKGTPASTTWTCA
ncbi:TonB-dependent siderophore receptor [Alicycliphilus sp. B1]|nr:TonB-dependent siderophore receptor [Alicycliphilus sp. B1]